ncbi:hypothetical protein BD408DRAFT_152989 [Parasitella parasitica]|nr:hypothetical protein BD408DRAFT_152989 [Parasitella parasitica]
MNLIKWPVVVPFSINFTLASSSGAASSWFASATALFFPLSPFLFFLAADLERDLLKTTDEWIAPIFEWEVTLVFGVFTTAIFCVARILVLPIHKPLVSCLRIVSRVPDFGFKIEDF